MGRIEWVGREGEGVADWLNQQRMSEWMNGGGGDGWWVGLLGQWVSPPFFFPFSCLPIGGSKAMIGGGRGVNLPRRFKKFSMVFCPLNADWTNLSPFPFVLFTLSPSKLFYLLEHAGMEWNVHFPSPSFLDAKKNGSNANQGAADHPRMHFRATIMLNLPFNFLFSSITSLFLILNILIIH